MSPSRGIFEIIVFNEESLLAFCFISFVFFSYNYLKETVYSFFYDFALKIELDLFSSFNAKHALILAKLKNTAILLNFHSLLLLLEITVFSFIFVESNAIKHKRNSVISSGFLFLLNDLILKQQKFQSELKMLTIRCVILPVILNLQSWRFVLKSKKKPAN